MRFAIYALATWRLASMLVHEEGPAEIFTRLRKYTGIIEERGDIVAYPTYNPLHCVACTSIYTAALLLILPQTVSLILAGSAISSILEESL